MGKNFIVGCWCAIIWAYGCTSDNKSSMDQEENQSAKIRIIFDTDANNELDDQHALAYLLLNGGVFQVEGVTVNATPSGGAVKNHYEEAARIIQLCNLSEAIPLVTGADKNFPDIRAQIQQPDFDGAEAVNFIIQRANIPDTNKLVVLAVGKLTNLALALLKDPSLSNKIRLVWLGSNYPKPGEYNQNCDTAAMSYVLQTAVPFEMVTVRYGEPSGTAAVAITQNEINARMPGLGPKATQPVTGRHGGTFATFGDYAIDLFAHIDYHDSTKSRALFDMAAVAIVKDPGLAARLNIPAPVLVQNQWVDQSQNPRTITIWEYFSREAILEDFFNTLQNPQPVKSAQ